MATVNQWRRVAVTALHAAAAPVAVQGMIAHLLQLTEQVIAHLLLLIRRVTVHQPPLTAGV